MLLIRPFKGIIYNKDKVEDISKVVTPPYDVISPAEQDYYYHIHPHNIIRIILGKSAPEDNSQQNRYTRAAHYFREWLSQGILKKEEVSSVYVYHQEYLFQNQKIQRKGFIGLMKLENFDSGVIFPHEKIFKQPQQDRLKLMLSCRANLSPIFSLFQDPSRKVDEFLDKGELLFELEDSHRIKHKLFALRKPEIIDSLCRLMADKKILIADGHHRYLTALKLREKYKKMKSFPAGVDYVMMYFLNTESGTTTILPVHRLIGGLSSHKLDRLINKIEDFFDSRSLDVSRDEDGMKKMILKIEKSSHPLFGMYRKKAGFFLLLPKKKHFFPRKVKSAIIDDLIREAFNQKLEKGKNIEYTPDAREAVEKVNEGRFQVAFFLSATTVEEIKEIAFAGKKMPPKSSYFYPKLLSGLVMRDLDDPID